MGNGCGLCTSHACFDEYIGVVRLIERALDKSSDMTLFVIQVTVVFLRLYQVKS